MNKKKKLKLKKVYIWENIIYKKYINITLSKKEKKYLLNQLCDMYSVSLPRLKRNKDKDCVGWYLSPTEEREAIIGLDKNCSLNTLCHEFAHHLCWSKWATDKHSLLFVRTLKEVYREINHLLTPKQKEQVK